MRLDSRVDTFAYPFGRYDDHGSSVVSCHFLCACSEQAWVAPTKQQIRMQWSEWMLIIFEPKDCLDRC